MGPGVGITLAGAAAVIVSAQLAAPPPAPGPAASESHALRVVVHTAADADQKVLARLRGHASDLPITFVIDQAPATEGDALAFADALAARADADVVVWFSHGRCAAGGAIIRDDLVVHIAQTKTRSVLVRAVGPVTCEGAAAAAARAADESAAFEAAAIVVRSALLAVSQGGTIGVVPPAPAAAAPSPSSSGRGPRPRLVVGALWTLDGLSPHGQPGLQARLGLRGDRLGVEAGLLATVPTDVTDDVATLTLSRAAFTLGGVAHQPLGARAFAEAALHAGVVLQMRTTTPHMAGVTADPASRLPSVTVSPEGRLGLAIPGVPGLAASLGVAADYIPFIPVIHSRAPDGTVINERRPWVLQPRASINIELGSP